MSWQDLVLTVGQVIFVIALVPTVVGKDKPALQTSVLTSMVSFSFMAVYVSLSVPFASMTAALNGSMWFVLAVQKWRERLDRRDP
jgi:hypothetical protein